MEPIHDGPGRRCAPTPFERAEHLASYATANQALALVACRSVATVALTAAISVVSFPTQAVDFGPLGKSPSELPSEKTSELPSELPSGSQPGSPSGSPSGSLAPGASRLVELGRFFEAAEPRSENLPRAHDLYCRAAATGHPEGLARLGWLHAKGLGVESDERVAATLFRWAAALGHPPSAVVAAASVEQPEIAAPCLVRLGADTLAHLRMLHAKTAATHRASRAATEPDIEASPPTLSRYDAFHTASHDAVSADGQVPELFGNRPPNAAQQRLVRMVFTEAASFRLDPRLVLAVVQTESNFNPKARSPKNALGLMQLIPDTARRFNVYNRQDPLQNLRGGMRYLRWLLDYYGGDVVLTLAAYNAGEGSVDRHRGVPPFRETIAYVQRIRALYPFDRHPFEPGKMGPGDRQWVLASSGAGALSRLD